MPIYLQTKLSLSKLLDCVRKNQNNIHIITYFCKSELKLGEIIENKMPRNQYIYIDTEQFDNRYGFSVMIGNTSYITGGSPQNRLIHVTNTNKNNPQILMPL